MVMRAVLAYFGNMLRSGSLGRAWIVRWVDCLPSGILKDGRGITRDCDIVIFLGYPYTQLMTDFIKEASYGYMTLMNLWRRFCQF
jgi:hypothetical protein